MNIVQLWNNRAYPAGHIPVSGTRKTTYYVPQDDIDRVFFPSRSILSRYPRIHISKEFPHFGARDSKNRFNSLVERKKSLTVWSSDIINYVKNIFTPHLQTEEKEVPIKCIQWHPQGTKLAVACWDDSIVVYFRDCYAPEPYMHLDNQTSISSIAWRPYRFGELAVGCKEGVYIWHLDPFPSMLRPLICAVKLLNRAGPVTCVEWSPEGHLLLTCSPRDSCIYLWKLVEDEEGDTILLRDVGYGVLFLKWSPNSAKVFAATTGKVFSVWETDSWTSKRSCVKRGRVQAACWSPYGPFLLFATTGTPIIYAMNVESMVGTDDDAKPVIDLTPVMTKSISDPELVGGLVESMVWNGFILAITFKFSNMIALFETEIMESGIKIEQSYFIKRKPGESPSCISFDPSYPDGCLLTIAWSSGTVSHFPIYYDYNECLSPIKVEPPYKHWWSDTKSPSLTLQQRLSLHHPWLLSPPSTSSSTKGQPGFTCLSSTSGSVLDQTGWSSSLSSSSGQVQGQPWRSSSPSTSGSTPAPSQRLPWCLSTLSDSSPTPSQKYWTSSSSNSGS